MTENSERHARGLKLMETVQGADVQPREIVEAIFHVALYAGHPPRSTAFASPGRRLRSMAVEASQ